MRYLSSSGFAVSMGALSIFLEDIEKITSNFLPRIAQKNTIVQRRNIDHSYQSGLPFRLVNHTH